MDASVVICTYTEDRWDDLVAAIESVRAQEPPVADLLVVVDHAPALEARLRREYPETEDPEAEHPAMRVVPNAGGQGLSGGRNTGIAEATGDVIVFFDDDATAGPTWVARLLAPLADPDVWVTGGLASPRFDDGRPDWFPPEFDWVVGCTYEGHPTEGELRNPIGCNMAFRRAAFDGLDGFREDMGRSGTRPLGCEETELCIRLRQADPSRRIVLAPGAPVTQRVPAQRATVRYFLSRCYSEGLSKAQVSRLVGSDSGLASERAYTSRVLPQAVVRNVGESVRRRSTAGLRRSAMILAGLASTAAGYARGRLSAG
ncbi:MAG: glycosyltransferase family 2 protein [Acidimicrobiales bacterium]